MHMVRVPSIGAELVSSISPALQNGSRAAIGVPTVHTVLPTVWSAIVSPSMSTAFARATAAESR